MKAISFRVDEWREPHWIMGQFLYVVKGQIFTDLSQLKSITHAVHPLTMYIENLEEGPFALFTLCGLCIDPPRPQHQLHIEIVGHSQCCKFSLKKPSSCFTACHSKIKERSPLHAYFLPTWQWDGGGKPYLRSNLLHHTEDFLSHAYFQSTEHKCQLVCCNIAAFWCEKPFSHFLAYT